MSDIDAPKVSGNSLTKKLGPLPVWAWGGILGVAVLGFYLLRKRADSTPAGDTTDGSALDTVDDPWTGPTTGTSNAAPTNPVSQSGSPSDNQSWLNTAITGTANALSASPSAVSSVLQRYLYDGGTFTAAEQKYIDKAITLYGAPPQGTGSTSTFTPPATTTPTTPTTTTKPVPGVPQKGQYQLITVQKANGKVVRLLNNKTGKQTWVKSSTDLRALLSWIQSINKGSATANAPGNLGTYLAAVA